MSIPMGRTALVSFLFSCCFDIELLLFYISFACVYLIYASVSCSYTNRLCCCQGCKLIIIGHSHVFLQGRKEGRKEGKVYRVDVFHSNAHKLTPFSLSLSLHFFTYTEQRPGSHWRRLEHHAPNWTCHQRLWRRRLELRSGRVCQGNV